MHLTGQPQLCHLHRCQRVKRTAILWQMTPGVASLRYCRRQPSWRRTIALGPWNLAHKLSFQLRTAEERARELEIEATHFRDRAARAEEWLLRIHNEVEHKFFEKKDRATGKAPRQ